MHPYVYNPCDMMDVEDNFIGVIILQVIRTLTCHIHLQLNLVAQSCLFATPWTAAHQVSLSFTISQSFLKLMSIESVMLSSHLILQPPFPFAFSLSQHQGPFPMSQFFTSGGQRIGASTSASVLPMNIQCWFPLEINWFYLLRVQVTLKSLLQHHNLKASILWPSLWSNSHIYTWLLEKP